MRKFKAVARNAKGMTFQFEFFARNRLAVEAVAKYNLDKVVANDEMHRKYGPWEVISIDVTG